MTQMIWKLILAAAIVVAGCAGRNSPENGSAPDSALPTAPWQGAPPARTEVPVVYLAEWGKADNRGTCRLIAFANPEQGDRAAPRAAAFGGGWAVAYDTSELRSAFGVAGAGVSASGATYDAWPYKRRWSDGSNVGYGPEGGTGPNQLAYLRISGQDCLYNVWSRLGRAHLESLLANLRFVSTGAESPS